MKYACSFKTLAFKFPSYYLLGLVLMLAACAVKPQYQLQSLSQSEPHATLSVDDQMKMAAAAGFKGFLSQDNLPTSLVFLPEPPKSVAPGSTDAVAARAAFKARSSFRWNQAATDADLHPANAMHNFACALGFEPTLATTPKLASLLQRTMVDAALATYSAKNHYNRTRPFVVMREQSCTPADEPQLAQDGSYPSGHTAIGWAWALLLSELQPSRRDVILRRGYSFGQSRVACGVHWQSDVDAGRVVGSAAYAALQNNAEFNAALQLAKNELASPAVKKQIPAAAFCAAEESALKNF